MLLDRIGVIFCLVDMNFLLRLSLLLVIAQNKLVIIIVINLVFRLMAEIDVLVVGLELLD